MKNYAAAMWGGNQEEAGKKNHYKRQIMDMERCGPGSSSTSTNTAFVISSSDWYLNQRPRVRVNRLDFVSESTFVSVGVSVLLSILLTICIWFLCKAI